MARKLVDKQWERIREIPEYIARASAPGTGKTPAAIIEELEAMRTAGTPKWGLSKLSQHLVTIRKAGAVCGFFFSSFFPRRLNHTMQAPAGTSTSVTAPESGSGVNSQTDPQQLAPGAETVAVKRRKAYGARTREAKRRKLPVDGSTS